MKLKTIARINKLVELWGKIVSVSLMAVVLWQGYSKVNSAGVACIDFNSMGEYWIEVVMLVTGILAMFYTEIRGCIKKTHTISK